MIAEGSSFAWYLLILIVYRPLKIIIIIVIIKITSRYFWHVHGHGRVGLNCLDDVEKRVAEWHPILSSNKIPTWFNWPETKTKSSNLCWKIVNNVIWAYLCSITLQMFPFHFFSFLFFLFCSIENMDSTIKHPRQWKIPSHWIYHPF